MPSEKFYEAPVTMYLRNLHGYTVEREVIGETSRSWLTGPKWSVLKYSKREYAVVTKLDYEREQWVDKHWYFIMEKIRYGRIPFDVLAKIADAIGYTEPRP